MWEEPWEKTNKGGKQTGRGGDGKKSPECVIEYSPLLPCDCSYFLHSQKCSTEWIFFERIAKVCSRHTAVVSGLQWKLASVWSPSSQQDLIPVSPGRYSLKEVILPMISWTSVLAPLAALTSSQGKRYMQKPYFISYTCLENIMCLGYFCDFL